MTILIYKKGDHPTGYQGCRVIGNKRAEKVDRYFAFSHYGHVGARRAAKMAEVGVTAERRELKVERLLYSDLMFNQMAVGFTARLRKERKWHKGQGEYITRFIPCFVVSEGHGRHGVYRIHLHGYRNAYRLAAVRYCKHHGLSKHTFEKLLTRIPDPTIFSRPLLLQARRRHGPIAKDMITDYLAMGGIHPA